MPPKNLDGRVRMSYRLLRPGHSYKPLRKRTFGIEHHLLTCSLPDKAWVELIEMASSSHLEQQCKWFVQPKSRNQCYKPESMYWSKQNLPDTSSGSRLHLKCRSLHQSQMFESLD